jgi:hypothetical protein
MRINEKSFNKKNLIIKSFLAAQIEKKTRFGTQGLNQRLESFKN